MSDSDVAWIVILASLFGMAIGMLKKRVAVLEDDVELILDGDIELAKAGRRLRDRRVARETGKDRL